VGPAVRSAQRRRRAQPGRRPDQPGAAPGARRAAHAARLGYRAPAGRPGGASPLHRRRQGQETRRRAEGVFRTGLAEVREASCAPRRRLTSPALRGKAGKRRSPLLRKALLGPVFRERLLAAMRIPVIEAAFPHPWTAAARRVLPSPSPQFTATAMWGPLLGWCALELLAESIDAENAGEDGARSL
jgi:hypothetical protein